MSLALVTGTNKPILATAETEHYRLGFIFLRVKWEFVGSKSRDNRDKIVELLQKLAPSNFPAVN